MGYIYCYFRLVLSVCYGCYIDVFCWYKNKNVNIKFSAHGAGYHNLKQRKQSSIYLLCHYVCVSQTFSIRQRSKTYSRNQTDGIHTFDEISNKDFSILECHCVHIIENMIIIVIICNVTWLKVDRWWVCYNYRLVMWVYCYFRLNILHSSEKQNIF
jgi:ABC-type transport system involved in Fe-S cluster assembly fused permease/ATPase subunit